MTQITQNSDIVTLINVFTVEPEDQDRLARVLIEATDTVINRQPGFVSANIHKSLDGTKVVNYAQWESREALEAMLENPEAIPHTEEAARIASNFEPHLHEVAFVDEIRAL